MKLPKIWVGYVFFKWYFEKKWVGRAMGSETIYWDGLAKPSSAFYTKRSCLILLRQISNDNFLKALLKSTIFKTSSANIFDFEMSILVDSE